jgi:hypothetical protein
MAANETRIPKLEDFPPTDDPIVIEGDDVTAFLESMVAGPVDEEYLLECDRVYERLYRDKPTNDLFK